MKRADSRWRALIASDLTAAYGFLTPAARSAMTLEQYKSKHRVGFYRMAQIDGATCDVEVCTVRLRLTYDTRAIKGMVTPVVEKWVLAEGQAWIVEAP